MEKNVSSESRQTSSIESTIESERSPYHVSSSSSSSSGIRSRKSVLSSSSSGIESSSSVLLNRLRESFTPLPPPLSSSSSSSDEEAFTCTLTYQDRLNLTILEDEFNEVDLQNCLYCSNLQVASNSLERIRSENAELELVNQQLKHQLITLLNLHLSIRSNGCGTGVDGTNLSPTSEFGKGFDEKPVPVQAQSDRVSMPKSISIRSNSYFRVNQSNNSAPADSTAPSSDKNASRIRVASKPLVSKTAQHIHLPTVPAVDDLYHKGVDDQKKEEDPLELDVYSQGMSKTELCKKWVQDGRCPYGEYCQFAHGLRELRPVIRHPRYKTEACRMVLNGGFCPYAHRCHFRHALTDQEKRAAGITHY